MRKLISAILLAILGIGILAPTTALARSITPETGVETYLPTSSNNTLSIKSVAVFSSYVVANDWLITAEIDNTKTPYANNGTVGRYFMVYLKSTDNSTIIAATPLKYWNDAPVAIYLAPSVTAGLTYGAGYQLQVIGTYTLPPSDNHTLVSSDWHGSDLRLLDDWVMDTARSMDTYYNSTDTDNGLRTYVTGYGIILSNRGGAFFTTAIPNLMAIRPNLFLLQSDQPKYTAGTPNPAFDSSSTWDTEVGSTIASDMTTFGNLFGITGKEVAGGILILMILFFAFVVLTSPASGAGLLVFSVPVLIVGSYLHIISVNVPLMIAMVCAFIFVRKYFWTST